MFASTMVRTFLWMSVALAGRTITTSAFQVRTPTVPYCRSSTTTTTTTTTTLLRQQQQQGQDEQATDKNVEKFLKQKFPSFHSLLALNSGIWKEIGDASTGGFTVFVPNAKAFENLGSKKLEQLKDERNLETAQKMGAYHVVQEEAVSAERLRTEDWTKARPTDGSPQQLTIGGIKTMGGEVPVGRSKSGGFLGFNAKEDGGIVVGPDSKILQSFLIGDSIVHEVDAFVSPELLWRYCDQLRIPGF